MTRVVTLGDPITLGLGDPVRTGQATARTVAALTAGGATVVTLRLPDPAQMFGLPPGLARPPVPAGQRGTPAESPGYVRAHFSGSTAGTYRLDEYRHVHCPLSALTL